MGIFRDFSLSTIAAGFLVALIGYAGPLLIYLQAAGAMGFSGGEFSSWVFAISLAAGVSSIVLSLWLRIPAVTAWSAPGTVLLISIGQSLPFAEIVGAYLFTALIILVVGASGLYDKLIAMIPRTVASGMMAGILFRFGTDAMGSLGSDPAIFAILMVTFLLLSVWTPRYTVILLLVLGVAIAWAVYDVPVDTVSATLATPTVTWPAFSIDAILSLGVPLVLITLSGQFLPGIAVIRANGFAITARPTLVVASLASIPAAFFGGITTALAAITAALAASPSAHADPARRYTAGIAAGIFLCLGAVFAGSIVELLVLLPTSMIVLLAGLALLGGIIKGMGDTLAGPEDVQAGLLAFMITTADFTLWSVNSAFWAVLVGIAAVHLTRFAKAASAKNLR